MGIRHPALLDWVKAASDESIGRTGTTRGYLLQIGYGHKKASAALAARIELATDGAASRKQLRPDDWMVIWPELHAA